VSAAASLALDRLTVAPFLRRGPNLANVCYRAKNLLSPMSATGRFLPLDQSAIQEFCLAYGSD
jgi:hypothetical protein